MATVFRNTRNMAQIRPWAIYYTQTLWESFGQHLYYNLTAKYKCDRNNENCMSDNCNRCSGVVLFNDRFSDKVEEDSMFKWYQWVEKIENGFIQKVSKEGSTTDALRTLPSSYRNSSHLALVPQWKAGVLLQSITKQRKLFYSNTYAFTSDGLFW